MLQNCKTIALDNLRLTGFNVKEKAKLQPCVILSNLYIYDPNVSLMFYMQMQDAIREQADPPSV
eukprot:2813326-Amphidinium_carterae.1